MSGGRGVGRNREVSPLVLLGARGDLRAAWAEAHLEEGGSRGKHGFPRGSEPKASDAHDALPWTASSASCVTSRERAHTTAETSSLLGAVTTTRSRLRNDLITLCSSSVATTTSGASMPEASRRLAASFVDGESNPEPSRRASVPFPA